MKKILFILALLLCPLSAPGQQGALQGTSTLGGISATTQGAQSSNKLQGVIPAAKISIYLTNTTTLATLTTDGTHSLSNPFYSNAANAVNPGGFVAFAATNVGYDIVASSGQGVPNCTTGPLCYTLPVTLCKDCYPSGATTGNPRPVCNVVDYGAVGDCSGSGDTTSCTDNHSAAQAAIDACYANGGSVYWPTNPNATTQTVYYTSLALNPKGVSMFSSPGGSGASFYYTNQVPVAVRGAPGKDVFDVVDASLPGYVAPHPSYSVRDLNILVDDSIDATASFPFRVVSRPCYDVHVTLGSPIITSPTECQFMPGDAGSIIVVTGAGSGGSALTATILSVQSATQATLNTNVLTAEAPALGLIGILGFNPTQSVGNCGFAYDDATATYSGLAPNHVDFTNVQIQTVSNNATHATCGFFFQGNQAPYQTLWEHDSVQSQFPLVYVPAPGAEPSTAIWTGIGDFNTISNSWLAGFFPIVSYNGAFNKLEHDQISSALTGPQILSSYGLESFAQHWTIDIPEYESYYAGCRSGLIGLRLAGVAHTVRMKDASFCSEGQALQWDASDSTAEIGFRYATPFNITGNNNTFTAPWNADWLTAGTTINNTGRGNKLTTGSASNPPGGVQPNGEQMAGQQTGIPGLASLSRSDRYLNRNSDFLSRGASNYYFNNQDLWLWPKDIYFLSGTPVTIADADPSTGSFTGEALSVPANSALYIYGAKTTPFYVGSQFPDQKIRFYVQVRSATSTASVTLSWGVYYSSAWHSTACSAFSATTSYAVFSCDVDLTGFKTDQFRFLLNGDSTNDAYVGWIGGRVYDSDPYGASGTVSPGTTGQYAKYAANSSTVSGSNDINITASGVSIYSGALAYTIGTNNTAVGNNSLYSNTSGSANSAYGLGSLDLNTSGANNSAIGLESLGGNTTGSANEAVGVFSGTFIADGSTPNATSGHSVYLGANTKALADGDVNEIVLGDTVTGHGSHTATIGDSANTDTYEAGIIHPLLIFSHAGTQLAVCSSTTIGTAWVSDASSLTPGTAYSPSAGAGAITVQVQCTLTGSTYAWQTM